MSIEEDQKSKCQNFQDKFAVGDDQSIFGRKGENRAGKGNGIFME